MTHGSGGCVLVCDVMMQRTEALASIKMATESILLFGREQGNRVLLQYSFCETQIETNVSFRCIRMKRRVKCATSDVRIIYESLGWKVVTGFMKCTFFCRPPKL